MKIRNRKKSRHTINNRWWSGLMSLIIFGALLIYIFTPKDRTENATATKGDTQLTEISPAPALDAITYDALQTIFSRITFDTTIDDLREYAKEYDMQFETRSKDSSVVVCGIRKPRNTYDKDAPFRGYHIEAKFNSKDSSFEYAFLVDGDKHKYAMIYNYGVFYKLTIKVPVKSWQGYYYYDLGGEGYTKCEDADDAIRRAFYN